MFRAIVLLITFLLPSMAVAGPQMQMMSVLGMYDAGSSGGGDCPSGTYAYYWDGDHSTSDVTACTSNGGGTDTLSQTGGTIGTATAEAGQGNAYRATANDQYLTDGSSFSINDTTGTVWMRFRIPDANGDRAAVTYFFEFAASTAGSTDNVVFLVMSNAETIRVIWEGNSTQSIITSTNTFTPNSWFWIGYSWDRSGTDKHSVYVSSGWDEETEALTAHNTAIDEFTIGENRAGGGFTENYDIDRVSYIGGTYQAANPGL